MHALPGAALLQVHWLGRMPYREAWDLQHRLVAARVAGRIPDQLLLLEHDAVLTLGRHADPEHVRADPGVLAGRGIELIRVERGGEVTYHGPGQLVAYPILDLSERGLMLRPLVRALEEALVRTCAELGVVAGRREGHPGCWCDVDSPAPRKIGALGIRVERGVSYHGIALNVRVDLADFELIDACGMPDVVSTSVVRELERRSVDRSDARATAALRELTARSSTEAVASAARAFAQALASSMPARLLGGLPPTADPAAERQVIEADLLAPAGA